MQKIYSKIEEIAGNVITVKADNVKYGELAEVTSQHGKSLAEVIRLNKELVSLQVFSGGRGVSTGDQVKFLGHPMKVSFSDNLLGRIFNGRGEPRDKGPVLSEGLTEIGGPSVNPAKRIIPRNMIRTGIPMIDVFNSLVESQKLPIFSASGLPHNRLAAQIVRQAKLTDESSGFSIIFAAMGVSYSDAHFFREEFASSGVLGNVVMYINLADDPPIERLALPRVALTTAEYLAFTKGMHILVMLTDLTNYCEALREIAAAREEVPGRRGYPGYMYTDLSQIYERAGRIEGNEGSITQIPILTMPDDDITHPIPDLTGYITEGQIVLSRDLHRKAIRPPVNVLPCLSRLMKQGIGEGRTRGDHDQVSNQLYAAYAEGVNLRDLVAVVGEEALTERDRSYLKFSDAFEREFIAQGEEEDRTIIDTLDLSWKLLTIIPKEDLKRIDEKYIDLYYPDGGN